MINKVAQWSTSWCNNGNDNDKKDEQEGTHDQHVTYVCLYVIYVCLYFCLVIIMVIRWVMCQPWTSGCALASSLSSSHSSNMLLSSGKTCFCLGLCNCICILHSVIWHLKNDHGETLSPGNSPETYTTISICRDGSMHCIALQWLRSTQLCQSVV